MGTFKEGLEYFPFNINEEAKLDMVSTQLGSIAYEIYFKMLCLIYKNGYFVEWETGLSKLFAKSLSKRLSQNKIVEVIDKLAEKGFFDLELFRKLHILTSISIQTDYFRATSRRMRRDDFNYEYLLIDIDGKGKSKPIEKSMNDVKEMEKSNDVNNKPTSSNQAAKKMPDKYSIVQDSIVQKSTVQLSEFASLTHINACARDKLTQFKIYIKKMMDDKDWQTCLKAVYVNENALFEHLEDNLNLYVNWLLVTAEDGSIVSFADFSRRFYYWIEKHWRKLRPEEKERKDSAEKKESMEERIIRKSLEERKRRDKEFQISIDK